MDSYPEGDDLMAAIGFELQEKILALQSSILSQHPTMPGLLREIHTALRKQPENVTLLSEEQIQIIVSGLEKQTGTFLAESTVKSAKKTAAVTKIKSLGADAF